MTKAERFIENAKWKHCHQSAMSNSSCCDINKDCTAKKLHDMCHKPSWNCRKQITSTRKQFQLKGSEIRNTMRKIFKGTDKMCDKFLDLD